MRFPKPWERHWRRSPLLEEPATQSSLDEGTFQRACLANPAFRFVVVRCDFHPFMDPLLGELLRSDRQVDSPLFEGFVLACRREGLWVAPNEPWAHAAIERHGWHIDLQATKVYNEWDEDPHRFSGLYPSDLRNPTRTRHVPFRYRQESDTPSQDLPEQLELPLF